MKKLIIFYISVISATVCSLKIKVITPPEAVERHTVVMECRFDLEGSTFKSVHWSKNGKEFLSLVQGRDPFLEAYPVPGILLNNDKTTQTQIVLTQLNRLSEGNYQCSVSTSGEKVEEASDSANLTVKEREPDSLLVATKNGAFKIDTKNFTEATATDDTPVYSIGYNLHTRKIFYSKDGGRILKADYDPEGRFDLEGTVIVSTGGRVSSITVDWLSDVLYFTDADLHNIGSIDLKTEQTNVLVEGVSSGVFSPESVVVDPFQKYLFWGDNDAKEKKIVASGLDGKTGQQTIVNTDLKIPTLALDLERRRLFYISKEGLSSCKYDGSSRKLHLQHPTLYDLVNSLSFYDDYAFWSRRDENTSSGLFYMAFIKPDLPIHELPIKSILDLKVIHDNLQKTSIIYSCDEIECSHECFLNKEGSAECSCPTNFTLTAGNTVCLTQV